MRSMKKMMVLILSVLMIVGTTMAVSFAATVTVKQNNTDGTAGEETYDLYKVFDVTKTENAQGSQTTGGGAGERTGFAYTINSDSPWFSVLGSVSDNTWSAAQGQAWVTLIKTSKKVGNADVYKVQLNDGKNSEAEAKAFANWLYKNKGTIEYDKQITSSSGTATTTEVTDGYYLIKSSLGTSLILATSDVVIDTKNQYPTTDKTVEKANYNVGDKVKYTITVNLPATVDYTKPVTVHDTMDAVLKLDVDSVHAKVTADNDFDSHVTLVQSSSFGSSHDSAHAVASGKTLFDFTLDISSLAPATGAEPTAKTVTITYEAELTSTAAADTEYVNKEYVEYSKYKTPEKDAKIKTFDFDLAKTFGGSANADLSATFELADAQGNTIQFITDSTGYVKKDSDGQNASATISVAGSAGGVNIRGLAAGSYTLTEKTTADGYNLLTSPLTITIDADGNVTISQDDSSSAASNKVTVNNQTGTELPSTGGMGTTIIYIIGGALVVVCGILLIARKRTNK